MPRVKCVVQCEQQQPNSCLQYVSWPVCTQEIELHTSLAIIYAFPCRDDWSFTPRQMCGAVWTAKQCLQYVSWPVCVQKIERHTSLAIIRALLCRDDWSCMPRQARCKAFVRHGHMEDLLQVCMYAIIKAAWSFLIWACVIGQGEIANSLLRKTEEACWRTSTPLCLPFKVHMKDWVASSTSITVSCMLGNCKCRKKLSLLRSAVVRITWSQITLFSLSHTHTHTHTRTHTQRNTHTHKHTQKHTHTETHTHTQWCSPLARSGPWSSARWKQQWQPLKQICVWSWASLDLRMPGV